MHLPIALIMWWTSLVVRKVLQGQPPSLLLQMVEDSQVHLEKTLSKILVEMLLDPTTSLPLDVDSMHKKMLRGPAGERCGGKAGTCG